MYFLLVFNDQSGADFLEGSRSVGRSVGLSVGGTELAKEGALITICTRAADVLI